MTRRWLSLVVLVLSGMPAIARSPEADAAYAAARDAEQAGNFDAALLQYETIYDSMAVPAQERLELRRRFAELRPKVAPNTDPDKAGVYRIRVYVFRTLDVSGESDGRPFHITNTYTDEQVQGIEAATRGFADTVWQHTMGSLRIAWDTVVIEEPLAKVEGWPDPASCGPHFVDLEPGEVDCVMVYANMTGVEPWALWGGTYGSIPEAKGAMYIGFNDNTDGLSRDPIGEVQVHEWFHAAQMVLESVEGYPPGLMVTSDCGGNCSGVEGETCYERKEGEQGWMSLYHHLLDVHVTRRMWRELSSLHPAPNVWAELSRDR